MPVPTSTFNNLPPFPSTITPYPLPALDYELLRAHDEKEVARLWETARGCGFWYMYNYGTEDYIDPLYDIGTKASALPFVEKMKYDQGTDGSSFGYKAAGSWHIDEKGTPDAAEFFNVASSDALAFPTVVHRTYPSPVQAAMAERLQPFVQRTLDVVDTLLDIFESLLALPRGSLRQKHKREDKSGTELRFIRNPPRDPSISISSIPAHSDFGSMTFVYNKLGGLQVLDRGTNEWQYVKPKPGHMVCNVGDTLALYSGGVLHSPLHRVVAPPGEQAKLERRSLAFLVRPATDAPLHALVDESPIVDEGVKRAKRNGSTIQWEGVGTAGEWYARRVRHQHIRNLKDGTVKEALMKGKGMEHNVDVV